MALYGIQTPGAAITATNADDQVVMASLTATSVASANTVVALDGNDLIYLGQQGQTATGSAIQGNVTFNIALSGASTGIDVGGSGDATNILSADVVGSATYSTSTAVVSDFIALSGASISGTITGGSVQVAGIVTSERAARLVNNSLFAGNAGNDSIWFGDSFTTMTSTTVQAGAGDDHIGNWVYAGGTAVSALGGLGAGEYALTASTIDKTILEAGGGNDTIDLTLSGGTAQATTIQASQGNDLISVIATAATIFTASQILAGGGDDIISGDFHSLNVVTIAGGGGNDSITLSADTTVYNTLVAGDTFNTVTQYDGADVITADIAGAYSSNTIQAGAGNDSVVILGATDNGYNQWQLGLGDDQLTGQVISGSSVFAGAGNDQIVFTAGFTDSYVVLGGGNDAVRLSAGFGAEGLLSNSTVVGGEGADDFFSGNELTGAQTLGARIVWETASDSTLSAMDTIAVTAGDGQIFNLTYEVGGLSRASTQASTAGANGFSATNGIVVFTSTVSDNITARVDILNAGLTTVGTVAEFRDQAGVLYTFIQGGSTDLVARVGIGLSVNDNDAEGMTGVSMTLGDSNRNITLTT